MNTYIREGQTIYFGSYYYMNNEKKEPIIWDIIDEKDGKALIISHNLLDSIKYDDKYNNYEKSYIRNWLNNDFYNIAFNDSEKEIIETTNVDNSAESTGYSFNKNVCNNTFDKIFLLSYKEVVTYFTIDPKNRMALTTPYTKNKSLSYTSKEGYLSWWLRSPYVGNTCISFFVSYDGDISFYNVYESKFGIRPACWIKLK